MWKLQTSLSFIQLEAQNQFFASVTNKDREDKTQLDGTFQMGQILLPKLSRMDRLSLKSHRFLPRHGSQLFNSTVTLVDNVQTVIWLRSFCSQPTVVKVAW